MKPTPPKPVLAEPAKFKCLSCGLIYQQPINATICPRCQHFYVKWLNFEDK